MRVAIISSLNYHNECIGFLCELLREHSVALYVIDDRQWTEFFQSLYHNISHVTYGTQHLDASFVSQYDMVIKLTSNDAILHDPRVISIVHLAELKDSSHRFISLTPCIQGDETRYMFPVYTAPRREPCDRPIVTYCGHYLDHHYDDDTERLLHSLPGFTFHFVIYGGSSYANLRRHPNVVVHTNVDTMALASLLDESRFILSRKPPHANYDRFSGMLALAMSFRTPILIDQRSKEIYGLPGIVYTGGYCDIVDVIGDMSDEAYRRHVDDIDAFNAKQLHANRRAMDALVQAQRNTVLLVEPRLLDRLPAVIDTFHSVLGEDMWRYVFFCGRGTTEHWRAVVGPFVELRELEVDNLTPSEHSFFMKQSSLWESISGTFVLTIQADTWIKSTYPYTIEHFMRLDRSYIGGNMAYEWGELRRDGIAFPVRNFNGGLSLRKRCDMIRVLSTFGVELLPPGKVWSTCLETDPEDVFFTIGCHRLALPLGDDEECAHFAVHSRWVDGFFGIHQPSHDVKSHFLRHCPEVLQNAPYL
jgi:hypothetical protein